MDVVVASHTGSCPRILTFSKCLGRSARCTHCGNNYALEQEIGRLYEDKVGTLGKSANGHFIYQEFWMVKLETYGLLASSTEDVKQRRGTGMHGLWNHCSVSLEENELEMRKIGKTEVHERLQQFSGKKYRGGKQHDQGGK